MSAPATLNSAGERILIDLTADLDADRARILANVNAEFALHMKATDWTGADRAAQRALDAMKGAA